MLRPRLGEVGAQTGVERYDAVPPNHPSGLTMRKIRQLALVVLAACACGGDGPTGVVTEASLVGDWILQTVNGRSLPAPADLGPNITFEYVSATLTLQAPPRLGEHGDCLATGTARYTITGSSTVSAPFSNPCTWYLERTSGLTVVITTTATTRGTVSGKTITIDDYGSTTNPVRNTLVYRKQ